jgi:predicted transcriptional regulator
LQQINIKYKNMELSEIKKQLPHGAIREIAKRLNVTEGLISRIYSGKIENSPKTPEVIKATAEYLKEYKAREIEAKEAITEALNGI